MRLYNVQLELPDEEQTIIERMLVAANFQQAAQLVAGIYGPRVSILSIIEKSSLNMESYNDYYEWRSDFWGYLENEWDFWSYTAADALFAARSEGCEAEQL